MVNNGCKSLNIGGRLMSLEPCKVMGIINSTPDSFYSASRGEDAVKLESDVRRLVDEGADILDIGGYSTRPGAEDVTAEEEYSRLARALEVVRRIAPEIPVSVDTFRAEVARRCVENWNVDIINDIGGGTLDPEMWDTVAALGVAYVLMHMKGTPATMSEHTDYGDVVAEVIEDLAFKVAALRQKMVSDVIVDPGFGFAKNVEQNMRMLAALDRFHLTGAPVLVGLSRKSMIWKPLGLSPEEALNGTSALNAIAVMQGADILRVHDVAKAREVITLAGMVKEGEDGENPVFDF